MRARERERGSERVVGKKRWDCKEGENGGERERNRRRDREWDRIRREQRKELEK